jgi:hypothetical protein
MAKPDTGSRPSRTPERDADRAASSRSAPSSKATIAFGEEFLYELKATIAFGEEFLYELKAGLRAAACGGRPRPADPQRADSVDPRDGHNHDACDRQHPKKQPLQRAHLTLTPSTLRNSGERQD